MPTGVFVFRMFLREMKQIRFPGKANTLPTLSVLE